MSRFSVFWSVMMMRVMTMMMVMVPEGGGKVSCFSVLWFVMIMMMMMIVMVPEAQKQRDTFYRLLVSDSDGARGMEARGHA